MRILCFAMSVISMLLCALCVLMGMLSDDATGSPSTRVSLVDERPLELNGAAASLGDADFPWPAAGQIMAILAVAWMVGAVAFRPVERQAAAQSVPVQQPAPAHPFQQGGGYPPNQR
ncbi:hypothetical protein [Actinokineospora sp. HUAS TT18]|uniref:hypothetical protein n=1 Tax=Actinokineospora sp. HUAS TT18 TaxID=3447451 RepID=UPI003F526EFC